MRMMAFKIQLLTFRVVVIMFLLFIQSSNAMDTGLNNACQNGGSWTQNALDETSSLIKTLESLKDDPDCAGTEMEAVANQLVVAEAQFKKSLAMSGQHEMSSQKQQKFLNKLLNSGDKNINRESVLELTAEAQMLSAIENTSRVDPHLSNLLDLAGMKSGLKFAATDVVNLINRTMKDPLKYSACLVASPNRGLSMISSMLKLSSNILTSGYLDDGIKMGELLSNLITFLRETKFTKHIKKLNQTELWSSINCALESATENYCTVSFNVSLLEKTVKLAQSGWLEESSLSERDISPAKEDSFLAGYYALSEDVPTITRWLMKIQFGEEPEVSSDGEQKNAIWTNITNTIKTIDRLVSTYNESKMNIEEMSGEVEKKVATNKLVNNLSLIMQLADASEDDSETSVETRVNFFLSAIPEDFISLYLVGYDIENIPAEVRPNENGKHSMDTDFWLENGGQYRPMFDDIPKLLKTIKTRMDKIIKLSTTEMSKFFVRKSIGDKANFVAEAFIYNQHKISVYSSLHSLLDYLQKLVKRIESSAYGNQQMIPIIEETIGKLERVINPLSDYLRHNIKKEESETASLQAEKIINAVYDNFNVLLQRDTFLTNRIATFVYYNYYLNKLEKKKYVTDEQALIHISDKKILEGITDGGHKEPALVLADYNMAMEISLKNLNALEFIFRDNFFDYLQTTQDDAEGMSISQRNLRTLKRAFHTDIPPLFKYSAVVPIIAATNKLFSYDYRYQIIWENPFKPEYQRGDNDHGSLMRSKNRTCIQLLATKNPEIFKEFCQDAAIISPFYEATPSKKAREKLEYLNVRFSDIIKVSSNGKGFEKSFYDRVCAYSNYLWKNQMYWLMKQKP